MKTTNNLYLKLFILFGLLAGVAIFMYGHKVIERQTAIAVRAFKNKMPSIVVFKNRRYDVIKVSANRWKIKDLSEKAAFSLARLLKRAGYTVLIKKRQKDSFDMTIIKTGGKDESGN